MLEHYIITKCPNCGQPKRRLVFENSKTVTHFKIVIFKRLIHLLGRCDMLKEKWIDNSIDLDTDSCKWLNKVITSYWLNSLRKFIYTNLKQVLDKTTAAFSKLKVVELEIGKEAPKIKNIVCHNSSKVRTHHMFSRILNL